MIGGAVTFVNPEPLALFADVIAAGEGEALIPPLLERLQAARRIATTCCGGWRSGTRLSTFPSFYDVQLRARTARSRAFVPKAGTGAPPVVQEGGAQDDRGGRSAGDDDLHARHRVRLALPRRGRPRLRQPVPLLLGGLQLPAGARVSEGAHPASWPKRARPYSNRAGLVSIALCDHPDIEEILTRLVEMGYTHQPGVAAARRPDADASSTCCAQSGERTITIAPETGSDRLRRVINKTVTNDEILRGRRDDLRAPASRT